MITRFQAWLNATVISTNNVIEDATIEDAQEDATMLSF